MELLLKDDIEPILCLNMIVKNESHIIKNTLIKLLNKVKFDYWVISDTGSTDNTKELITEFFKEVNIPGELYDDEWTDFGHNRTLALDHAFDKSKYLMIFDADDEICGDFVLPDLTKDSYHFQFGDANGTSYTRTQIVNNKKKWKYVGVLHEIITSIEPSNDGMNIISGNYYTVSGKSGDRSRDVNKYLKDALILEKAYEQAIKNNDDIYHRYGFYCANSYYDCGNYEDAIKWYKKTLDNNNWSQEKYVSCLRIFNCYRSLNQQETGMFYLVKSTEYDKERTECLYELISYYCCKGSYEVAYGYFSILKPFFNDKYLSTGLNNKLFVDSSKANLFLPYYMILVADKVLEYDTVIQMYRIIFTQKHKEHSKFFIGNMLYNLQFFIEKVKPADVEFNRLFKDYVAFLISINYPIHDHEFMSKYEKYGIKISNMSEPFFTLEECSRSKNILIYSGYAPSKWNNSFSVNNALGGSETAIACLSQFFPKEYNVYVAGEVDEEKFDNITYVNLQNLQNLIKTTVFHTIIVSRYLNFYEVYKNFSAYQTFIWGHDVALYQYGSYLSAESILTKWSSKITGCICQTEWHKNHFHSLYPQLKDKITVINNGIAAELFTFKNKKVSNKFIYTSCSERGLGKLIRLWPTILENLPDAELTISSYNNFPKSEEDNTILEYIKKTPSVTHVGKLNRTDLYNLMSTAEYWLYPSYFQETSCITSLELLASEVICLYYPVAGLINTVGDYGIPISEGNEIDTLLNLSIKQKSELKKKGKQYALSCSWKNRADEWTSMICSNEQKETNKLQHINNESTIEKNNIKVINLKKREDRKNSMKEQFKKENVTNYEFIEAVDGNELKETEELRLLFHRNNFTYRKGIIGCALSHIQVWNDLINDIENDFYVVLEDDLELSGDFKAKLNRHCQLFEEQQLEHLSLGSFDCNYLDQEKIKTSEITIFQKDVYKFWNVAFAYIISKNAALKMVSYINKCSIKCAIDNPLSHGEVVKYSHTTFCIAKQKNLAEVGSDIQNNNNNLQFTSNTLNTLNSKNELKIAYCDWWQQEYCGGVFDFNNNFITDILRKYGNVGNIILVDPNNETPDVLLYSIFGNEHTKYPNVRRVFFSGEPFGIREEADFNFTFDRNSDKNTRFPLWLGYLNDYLLEECQRRKNGIIDVPKRENFCSFISNGEVKTTHRRNIVEKLSAYKNVHCGGNYLNNIGFNVPRGINCSGKIEHNNKYKFAIAFENEDYPGYVTEKICDVFKSNCIPIYWGTTEVVNDFNPSTFINATDFANFDELIEYIIKVDNDDELYASFFKEPMFSNKWLDAFNDPNKSFYKNLADCIIGKNKNLYDAFRIINYNNDNVMKNVKDVFLSQEVFLENETITKKYDISIMAIFKNETMNLRVWLGHYLWQGVTHFYLIDNGSTDNPLDILQEYIDKGVVTYYYRAEKYQQVRHYRYVFDNEKLKDKTKWLCICDLDELFFGTEQILANTLCEFDEYNVIYTNSYFYGSDNLIDHPKDIRTSILHREEDIENGTKYIFKPSSINDSSEIWIHWLVNSGTIQKKQMNEITQNNKIRLNHYRIQSFEYFKNVKMTRGDVSVQTNEHIRDLKYFEHYTKVATIKDDLLKQIVENGYDNLKLNNINTAVIVEPRFLRHLPFVINDFYKKLGLKWKIVFYCGEGLKNIWLDLINNQDIEIRELKYNCYKYNEYCDFIKSKELWENLYGDYVLLFTANSIIINQSPYTIDYFMSLNNSYIGGNQCYLWNEMIRENIHPKFCNFQGGLSLRKRLDMIRIINKFGTSKTSELCQLSKSLLTDAEDVYFAIGCYKLGFLVGDDEICSHFSVHNYLKDGLFGANRLEQGYYLNLIQQYDNFCDNIYLYKDIQDIDNETLSVHPSNGFFSNCTIRLLDIILYFNAVKKLPIFVDSSKQFDLYKSGTNMNDITCKYFSNNLDYTVNYQHPIDFREQYQYTDYETLKFNDLSPFIKKYFSPVEDIKNDITYIENKYNINNYDDICVLFYRGNDKRTETCLPSYESIVEKARTLYNENNNIKFLVQSDEIEFIEKMIQEFPNNSFYFKDEIRTMNKNITSAIGHNDKELNFNYAKIYLAITIIMSKCKYIVCSSGNCSLWIALYRGNTDNVYQY